MKIKSALSIFLIFLVGSAFSQSNKKQHLFSFKIVGSVKNYHGGFIYLHHKWEDKDYTDSAMVDKNAFRFELKSPEPNMYWFTLTRELTAQPNFIFFADACTIKIQLIGDSIASSHIEGGSTQKDYETYMRLSVAFTSQQQKLQAEFNLASQQRDQERINKISQTYQSLAAQHIAALTDFVKSHPKSAVSGYVIYKEFNDPNMPIDDAVVCLNLMDKSIENTKFVKLATKRINDRKGTQIGAMATDFSQATPEGKQIRLSEFKGKYVLVDFWASWCGPCRMENPNVLAAYNQYKDKGFTVLGVSLDASREQWMAAIQADHLSWTNISDLKGGANEAAILYNIQSIPQNVLINREGIIVAKNLRGAALDEKLKTLLQ